MAKQKEIIVKDTTIRSFSQNGWDYICITDIARQKNTEDPNAVVGNWMRNRNTIEYLGIWEALNNPNFNPLEFEGFRSQAGLNAFTLSPSRWIEAYANEADVLNVALFGMTAKEWRDAHPEDKGNIRDYATINQLICLSNMENLNAVFINEGLPQGERLQKLNQIAIQQMTVLENVESKRILKA